jgi:hypothetical protein
MAGSCPVRLDLTAGSGGAFSYIDRARMAACTCILSRVAGDVDEQRCFRHRLRRSRDVVMSARRGAAG